MALPPYSYGGTTRRDAMLTHLQDDPYAPTDDYRYPTNPQLVRARAGTGAAIADTAGALAPTVAKQIAPQVATSLVEGGAAPAAGLGSAALPIGLATEIGGALLKPKVQAPTASPYADLTDPYRRRQEGSGEGIAGGATKWGGRGAQVGSYFGGPVGAGIGAAAGALGGALGGAFTKNAASAYSDFSRADAVKAIQDMYRTRGGREVSPADLDQILVGAGTKPGDQWVGEQALYSILNSLDTNFAAERQPQVPEDPNAPVYAHRAPAGANDGVYGAPANTVGGPAPAPAGTAPAADTAAFDTDGYAAPQLVAPATGAPPPGWDATKWANPNHQTPKYAVGRILAQYAPRVENMPAVVAEIQKAYPGTTFNGKDKISIPGVGDNIDILGGASSGGTAWRWGVDEGRGASGAGVDTSGIQSAADAARGYAEGGDIAGGSDLAAIIARIGRIAGGEGAPGIPSARDLVLQAFR